MSCWRSNMCQWALMNIIGPRLSIAVIQPCRKTIVFIDGPLHFLVIPCSVSKKKTISFSKNPVATNGNQETNKGFNRTFRSKSFTLIELICVTYNLNLVKTLLKMNNRWKILIQQKTKAKIFVFNSTMIPVTNKKKTIYMFILEGAIE